MFRTTHACAAAAALLLVAPLAHSEEIELKNDGFVEGGMAVCNQGFATGDQGAASFSFERAYVLKSVRFFFCGADTTETVTVRIYDDFGTPVPGGVRFQDDYQVTGAPDSFSEVDLSSATGLSFAGGEAFRFALVLQHDGPPGLARDDDNTVQAGVNWIYDTASSTWGEASQFNVMGDWIIRATIETDGAGGQTMTTTSTGPITGGAGGVGGAGGAAADDGGGEDCSCREAGHGGGPSAALLGLLAAGAIHATRRRTHKS